MAVTVKLLNPRPKRRINHSFNAYIQPRLSDIDHVERDRRMQRNDDWIKKGSKK